MGIGSGADAGADRPDAAVDLRADALPPDGSPAFPRPGLPFSTEHADPSAPAGASGAFAGPPATDPASAPTIVYPLGGAMLGRNIGGMNIQWAAGQGNTIFRARIRGDQGEAFLFAGAAACPAGKCQLNVPDPAWREIAVANAGARITLTVEGVPAAGGAVARSADVALHFTPEDLRGGLYYWSTRLKGILRVPVGTTTPEPFVTPDTHGGCVGCHTVSADGCRIAFTHYGGQAFGVISATDASRSYLASSSETSYFSSFSADGSRLVTLYEGEMTIRDGNGTALSKVPRALVGTPPADAASHPAWSPDGAWIVFTRLGGGGFQTDTYTSGDIMRMPYAAGAPGPAEVLVAHTATEFHYYPSFSPDGDWVVFNSAVLPEKSGQPAGPGRLSAADQPSARLRLVPAAGGPAIELAKATHAPGTTASWPKFSPFIQVSGRLLFIVFSSKMDYGWVLDQTTVPPDGPFTGRPQLWAAAIDLERPGDPSFAPFWLPFQRHTEGNHLAFWTTRIAAATAGPGSCE